MPAVRLHDLKRRLTGRRAGASEATRRDRALARRLVRTFERDLDLAGASGIDFYVRDGVVTLRGSVWHELDRELLLSLVRPLPGVREVVSHLQVAGTDPGEQPPVAFFDRPGARPE